MEKHEKLEKVRNMITVAILVFTVISCVVPILTKGEIAQTSVISAFGENVQLYGKGIYARNSFSMAMQAIAQDLVTLILVVPATIVSLMLVKKKHTVAEFILTGLLAYMLYTYMSYSFLMYYNELFLVYVALMVLSFYAFVISIHLLSKNPVIELLQRNMKTMGLRIFLVASGIVIALMWLGRIVPTIGTGIAPVGLDHYSTLVIQVLDLGIIVPTCFVICYLLKEKNTLGYVLAPVIVVKAVTLVLAVLAMAACMALSGIEVAPSEFMIFGGICLIACYYLFRILREIDCIAKKR